MQIGLKNTESIQGFIVGVLFLAVCWLLADKVEKNDQSINSHTQQLQQNVTQAAKQPLETEVKLAGIMIQMQNSLREMDLKISDQNTEVKLGLGDLASTIKVMAEQNKSLQNEVVRTRESLRNDLTNTNAEVFSIKKEIGVLRQELNELQDHKERITSKIMLLEQMIKKG